MHLWVPFCKIGKTVKNSFFFIFSKNFFFLFFQNFFFSKILNFPKKLKKINKACKVFYNEMDLPFISNRELYSYGLGINKLEENGSIYIMSKTIDHVKNELFFLKFIKIKRIKISLPNIIWIFQKKTINALE